MTSEPDNPNGEGYILDRGTRTLYGPLLTRSLVARGYWTPYTGTETVSELLRGVTNVPFSER